jgi:hypothetical protein
MIEAEAEAIYEIDAISICDELPLVRRVYCL